MSETGTPSISNAAVVIGRRSILYLVFSVLFSFLGIVTITILGSLTLLLMYITMSSTLELLFAFYTIIGLSVYFSQILTTGKADFPEETDEFNLVVVLVSSIAFYSFMIMLGALAATIALAYTTPQIAFAVAILYGPLDMELLNNFGVSPATLLAVIAVAVGLLAGLLTETASDLDPRDIPGFTWGQFRKRRFGRFNI